MPDLVNEKRGIDLRETVAVLGVSSATVKNWIRHNYLTPEKREEGKILFNYVQVVDLKEKIRTGEIDRLSKRANKKHSANIFIPEEYIENENIAKLVEVILSFYKDNSIDKKSILLAIAINLLQAKKLITIKGSSLVPSTQAVKEELGWWHENIENKFILDTYRDLLDLDLSETNDILGLIYQSISTEGNKAEAGSYYTPKNIVDEIVDELIKEDFIVLDPCCGTGQFLLSAARKIKNPENIWGFDIDEIAVRIARLNILLRFPKEKFKPQIYHKNTLLEVGMVSLFTKETAPRFDAVITNPPWGVHFSESETIRLANMYPSVKSNEAFSYFLQKGMQLLKNGGVLSFILPESILNIKTHKDIRNLILEQSKIEKIKYLDRIFKNVFTPVIRLDITHQEATESDELVAEKDNQIHNVKQSRLKENHDFIFDVFSNNEDLAIFEKIYSKKYETLENNADWALGIVTGNNQKFLSDLKTQENEPILTGKDIQRFVTKSPKKFINYDPEAFQQVAPEGRYRAKEKLIYKFISKQLVFAYDNQQTLTLNSANILIPRIEQYPIKSILAFLNSSLYQFLHQKKFASLKVLRSDLEKLPFPILEKEQHKHINTLVKELFNQKYGDTERMAKYLELDDYIMNIFNLSLDEKKHIKENVTMSEKLLIIE